MLENIATGFEMFFTLANLLAITAGVCLGVTVGAIPGLTAAMAVALALPFTFNRDPVTVSSVEVMILETPGPRPVVAEEDVKRSSNVALTGVVLTETH